MEIKEIATKLNERLDEMKGQIEDKATLKEFNELKNSIDAMIEKGATKEDIEKEYKKLEKILEEQGKQITAIKRGKIFKFVDVKKAIEEKLDSIKSFIHSKRGEVELYVQKAVALVTTANVADGTIANQNISNVNGADESNAGNILRGTWIETYSSVSRIARAFYSYVDWKPKEGDAAVVTEGGTKPQIDFQAVTTQVAPTKVAAFEYLTEESITDIDELDSVAREILLGKVMLKRQATILSYVNSNATAYVAGGALSGKVDTPNLFDVVKAVATQIYMTENYTDDPKAIANVAFVNPYDFAEFQLSKNADGSYILPQFAQMDGVLAGIKFIENPDITAGHVLVGDFKKLNIKNYIDYSVRLGVVNAQFIDNEFTMVGETRYFAYIKNLDTKAFVDATIATVIADINKP